MKFFHPSRRRLNEWVRSSRGQWIERHARRCDRCADMLDEITTLDPRTLRELQQTLTPPAEIRDRMKVRIRDESLDSETLTLLGDLFGVGWLTTTTLLEEDEDDR